MISIAATDEQIARCFAVMAQLRPHLSEAEFVARVRRQMAGANYALAFLETAGQVRSVAGYRVSEDLHYGRYLYVDDLVTAESSRSRGHGRRLFQWLVRQAKDQGCQVLTLDSGVQRFGAHRFYLTQRMDIVCYHFALKLA